MIYLYKIMYSVNKEPERQRNIRVLKENPVEDYLKEHPNLLISHLKVYHIYQNYDI